MPARHGRSPCRWGFVSGRSPSRSRRPSRPTNRPKPSRAPPSSRRKPNRPKKINRPRSSTPSRSASGSADSVPKAATSRSRRGTPLASSRRSSATLWRDGRAVAVSICAESTGAGPRLRLCHHPSRAESKAQDLPSRRSSHPAGRRQARAGPNPHLLPQQPFSRREIKSKTPRRAGGDRSRDIGVGPFFPYKR